MNILANGVAVCANDSHHGIWCASEGLKRDRWMCEIIRNIIRERNIKVCIDAGANIGTLTREMLDCSCEVHAFECNKEAIECLEHNCWEAHIYRVALSYCAGELPFTRCENAGASFVSPVKDAPAGAEFVLCKPLDDYDLNPGLIKVDIEGAEVAFLRGAKKTIEKFRPVIICEVNAGALQRAGESTSSLMNTLVDLGYPQYRILQPDCNFGSPQFDIVCMP